MNHRGRLSLASFVVFVLALLIRLPACEESFWVDELHTAWTVHGTFYDVTPRARIGNQQPTYFWLLWLWKSAVGNGEASLRFSSVLAVAVSSSLLVIAVSRMSEHLAGGIAAGLMLAIESNSLFFGTELRPYAAVMLATTVSCACAAELWVLPAKERGLCTWGLLFFSIAVAASMQLTSLGVLVWLPIAVVIHWLLCGSHSELRLKKIDAIAIGIVAVTAFAIVPGYLLQTWNSRQMWASFGTAKSFADIWRMWPWLFTLILPLGFLAFTQAIRVHYHHSKNASYVWCLAIIVVCVTILFWTLSYCHLLPLWHRRYLIGVLPMLAWCFGASIAAATNRRIQADRYRVTVTCTVSLALLSLMLVSQGTLKRILKGQVQLVTRGEDWRAAISYLNRHAKSTDDVVIDPGLIEQTQWHNELARLPQSLEFDEREYLTFVVGGPYQLLSTNRVIPLAANLSPLNQISTDMPHRRWVLSRRTAQRLRAVLRNHGVSTIRSFGRVSIAVVQ